MEPRGTYSIKGIAWSIVLLTLFFLVVNLFLFFLHRQRETTHLQQVTEQQWVQLQSIRYSLENTADILFENLSDNTETAEIMSQATQASGAELNNLRQRLLEKYMEIYASLVIYGIDILQFHLPQSVTFLTFPQTAVYNDPVNGVRHSLELVNERKQAVHGFEEGRLNQGFRNVYPLFYWDEFVGTVEISLTFQTVRKLAARLFPAVHTLILHEDVVVRSLLKEEQERYVACRVSPVYRKNSQVAEIIKQELPDLDIVSFEELQEVNDALRELVGERLARNEAFSLAQILPERNTVLVTTFLPVTNIRGEEVGYFVSYREDSTLKGYNQRYHQVRFVTLLLALFSFAVVFLYLRQIRRRKRYEILATVDGLTGLANRAHFDLVLSQAVRQGKRNSSLFSLVLFDIDDFKKVNDTYGHDGGDKVLIHLSTLVRGAVREQDLVARWGGEEFVILLPDTGRTDARFVTEKVRKMVRESVVQSGYEQILVTCSFGVAQFEKTISADDLLKKADLALYQAKRSGKDCVVSAE